VVPVAPPGGIAGNNPSLTGLPPAEQAKARTAGLVAKAQADAKQLDAWRAAATETQLRVLPALNEMEKASANGVSNGPEFQRKMDAANFLKNTLGVPIDATKLAQSQVFEKEANDLIQTQLKAQGGNGRVLASQIALVSKIVPQLTTDPAARVQLINILRQSAQQRINLYQAADKPPPSWRVSGRQWGPEAAA
jgi:hypothetical protein